MNLLGFLSVNRYYRMSENELVEECSKWNIAEFSTGNGLVSRELAIRQLIEKDKATDSRYAVVISLVALIISILALSFGIFQLVKDANIQPPS